MSITVGIVGTGEPNAGIDPEQATKAGFSVAYRHAPCYRELAETELVACADLVEEHRTRFAAEFGIPTEAAFSDVTEMIDECDLDVVDVCTPVSTHADLVVECARAGVEAIHCEKPMADTWAGARRMVRECDRRDVQLTINHQRRFGDPFREADRLLEAGEIGDLERVEIAPGALFSYGTHSIDLCGMFTDEQSATWVIGAIDYREENTFSGAHNENQALVQWEYDNGVTGLAASGPGENMIGAHHRLLGDRGVIEVGPGDAATDLRIRRMGQSEWEHVDTGSGGLGGLANGYPYMQRAIADAIGALVDDRPSELSAENALNTAEIVFAAYESVRRRGRVDLPLRVDDNPLEAMLESDALDPQPSED